MNKEKLLCIAKQCLSIVEESTMKNKEINMLIESAISDMSRVNIDTEKNIDDNLVINTIMLYVKAHFGDTDINKRKMYLQRYKINLRELQFSEKYQIKEVESNA